MIPALLLFLVVLLKTLGLANNIEQPTHQVAWQEVLCEPMKSYFSLHWYPASFELPHAAALPSGYTSLQLK